MKEEGESRKEIRSRKRGQVPFSRSSMRKKGPVPFLADYQIQIFTSSSPSRTWTRSVREIPRRAATA